MAMDYETYQIKDEETGVVIYFESLTIGFTNYIRSVWCECNTLSELVMKEILSYHVTNPEFLY